MAMGNLRDGGLVCLGIDNTQIAAMAPGLSQTQLTAWSDFDDAHDALARYCEPPVSFHLFPLRLSNGIDIVVLEVSEFDHVPHICKRDYQDALQNGATYVRPHGKPRSVVVPSATEMRELLDLATTKGVREFIRRIGDVGVALGSGQSVDEATREAFATEAATAWSSPGPDLDFVLTKGHFDVAVRPSTYDSNRVSPASLESLISSNAVRLRGWPIPYIDHQIPILRHGSWIGQDIEARVVPHSEAWRMCTSGQFLHRRVFRADLSGGDGRLNADAPGATGAVVLWEVLSYLVELAEFGARLASTIECESVTIDVALDGISGRQLISGDWSRKLDGDYIIHTNRLMASETRTTAGLLRDTRGVGITLSQTLFKQFGLNVPDQVLIDWQVKILRG